MEAEQSLLGSLLLENDVWDRVADVVGAADFYRADHRHIFTAIVGLIEHGKAADVVTVYEHLNQLRLADAVGGLAYLAEMANSVPSTANAKRYAEILRERAIARRMIEVCSDAIGQAHTPSAIDGLSTEMGLLDHTMQRLGEIAESGVRARSGPRPVAEYAEELTHLLDQAAEGDGDGLVGVSTGLRELDRRTLGLSGGDVVVIAGRPGMGKTSLALNMAEHIAVTLGKPALIFSMEMPGSQLLMRMTSSLSGVDSQKIRVARLTDQEWSLFSIAMSKVGRAPIEIDETGALTPTELRARARRAHRRLGGLGVIVVDYLQLMQVGDKRRSENRNAELTEISRSIKALAKELGVPILALSQLNRSLEQRHNRRPVMSDLRESGAIEQDADVILFIYRDEVYNADTADRGAAEIIIGKQRNGPIGTVNVAFDAVCSRFRDLD
jgi:replicative DNA helicase